MTEGHTGKKGILVLLLEGRTAAWQGGRYRRAVHRPILHHLRPIRHCLLPRVIAFLPRRCRYSRVDGGYNRFEAVSRAHFSPSMLIFEQSVPVAGHAGGSSEGRGVIDLEG